jgi:glycosyltransferase involved in cell wall biosynthesis
MKLIILLPAYNEASTIGSVLDSLPKKLSGVRRIIPLVVNDGSTDKTAQIAKRHKAKVLTLKRNSGVGNAMQVGLEAALQLGADLVVTMDADGQFTPGDIPKLLKPLLKQEAEMSTGSRFLQSTLTPPMPMSKLYGNKFLAWALSKVLQRKLSDVSCGFRAYTREALLRLQLFGRFTYTQEMFLQLAKNNLEFVEVPVLVQPTKRPGGKSHVAENVIAYGWKAGIILLRSFRDYKPFLFFGVPSVTALVLGLVGGIFVVGHYLLIGSFTPYKAFGFAALFSLLGGTLLGVFALMADMLDRQRQQQDKILYYLRKKDYDR